jgi:hypothetical protein
MKRANEQPLVTRSLAEHLNAGVRYIDFMAFWSRLRNAMDPGESGPTDSEKARLFDLFEQHEENVLLGAVYIRIVDSFLTYIADVLAEVHLAKPETLAAKEIKVARILNRKQEDWLAELAEERVDSLVRGGFKSIIEDVGKNLGVRLAPDDRAMAAVVAAVEVRNVLVHNRGVVDRRAASKLKLDASDIDGTLDIDEQKLVDTIQLLGAAARHIDHVLSGKFPVRLGTWNAAAPHAGRSHDPDDTRRETE